MADTVHCDEHGETEKTYVCTHLVGESSGLGFNCEDPSEENPYPDAWCDACETIRAEYSGWDDVPEGLCDIRLLCARCYERAKIRNTRPSVTLGDLSNLRWKCGSCEDWHWDPMLISDLTDPTTG